MPLLPDLLPAPMHRVAVVGPSSRWRRILVAVADAGSFEPDEPIARSPGPVRLAADAAVGPADEVVPMLSAEPVDPSALERDGALDLLLGEASLEDHSTAAHPVGRSRILPGWARTDDVDGLRTAVEPLGGGIVDLPGRRGLMPPTVHADSRAGAAFRPLVSTYATVPYRDLDPTLFAAIAYVLMFGMMFGDVAHGLAIVIVGVVVMARHRDHPLAAASPFLLGAGLSAVVFGLLYGEAFGPTGLVPTLWLRPLDEPETLLLAGLAVGGALLAITFAMSIVDRWREGGPALALYEPSGIAGALLLVGAGATALGSTLGHSGWFRIGLVVLAAGALLMFAGLIAGGIAQALVELFDALLRLGSNIVSFTRLAAFGLTHAVISEVVWDGTTGLWDRATVLTMVSAVALFAFGNVAAFALGALVAAIQALRLEYYELFSRLFISSGRPFRPWHVPTRRREIS